LVAEDAATRSGIAVGRDVQVDDLQVDAEKWPDEKLVGVKGEIDCRLRGDAGGRMVHVGTHENAVFTAEIANGNSTVDFFDPRVKIRNEVVTDLAVVQNVAAYSYRKRR
jgi:hypothetical protein